MKKLIGFLGVVATVMLLAACHQTTAPKATPLVVAGHTFAGDHTGFGTHQDPNQRYTIQFGKDKHFVATIVDTKGGKQQLTYGGTYRVEQHKRVVLAVAQTLTEQFAATAKDYSKVAPLKVTTQATPKTITLTIRDQRLALGDTVDLTTSTKTLASYATAVATAQQRYADSYGRMANKVYGTHDNDGFGSAFLAFKDGHYILMRHYMVDYLRNLTTVEGTYTVADNKLTLQVAEQSPTYYNNGANVTTTYEGKNDETVGQKKLTFRIGASAVTSTTPGPRDTDSFAVGFTLPDITSAADTPKYDAIVAEYGIAALAANMTQGAAPESK